MFSCKMCTVLNRMKNQFSDFCILSYGFMYLQFTVTHRVCQRPQKNVVQKWPNLQERCALLWKWFFSSWVLFMCDFWFLRYGRFCIWLTLMYVNSCMQKSWKIFANLIQTLISEARVPNPKACGVHWCSRGGRCGGKAPAKIYFLANG